MLRTLASACVLAVLAFTSTTVHAQTVDNRTFFTFNQPVTLPGVTLPAGKYLFRNPDITTSRRVVQVLSDDGKQSYAMLLTIPAQRTEASVQPEIRFMETAAGTPPAIRAWWYPGNTIGWEFIYPKEQALKLAKASSSVLTTATAQNDTAEEMKTAALARVTESGGETAVTVEDKPAATAVAGTAQQGQIAEATIQIPTTPTPVATTAEATSTSGEVEQSSAVATATTRTRLPQTGSSAPAMALLGVCMLAVGSMLFRWPSLRL